VIRAVGNKRLSLSNSEYSYYLSLRDKFGDAGFVGLFSTDKNGIIKSITPPLDNTVHVGVVYFILNIMMSQRVRMLDSKIAELRLKYLEENVDLAAMVDNIAMNDVRLARLEEAVFGESND